MNAPVPLLLAPCPKRAVRRMCADVFGVAEHRLVGHSRRKDIVIPRMATCYVLRQRFPDMSFPRLGRFMGGRDHSTIINAIRQTEIRMERDAELRGIIENLIRWPIPGLEPDSHVRLWRAWQAHLARNHLSVAKPVKRAPRQSFAPDDELAEFAEIDRVFCEQCDRAVPEAEARRCTKPFCKAERPATSRI